MYSEVQPWIPFKINLNWTKVMLMKCLREIETGAANSPFLILIQS